MLTTTTIIEATLTYGIVHAIWFSLKHISKEVTGELRKERNHIIRNHVKTSHQGRLKHCLDDACASLRMPGLHSEVQPVQPERAQSES